ncbi:MAG: NAD-dependent epimerase/dehydratase family protein [bacterium]
MNPPALPALPARGSVVVTGAASQIGFFLLPRLAAAGFRVIAVSRRPETQAVASFGERWTGHGVARWIQADLEHPLDTNWVDGCDYWINLGPLQLVPRLLESARVPALRRVIAFGSTSRFTKAGSTHPREQRIVADLEAGEAGLARSCAAAGIGWTLFRPTLIYGAGLDRNVMVIAAAIRRFGVFPLVGGGAGLRQPVHADDLAAACMSALAGPGSEGRAYDLSGSEVLSYRELVLRIFRAVGRPPRWLPVPVAAVGLALWGLSCVPRYRDFNIEMARRMAKDMVFDHGDAQRDFGYRPRSFEPVVERPV